jgi:hypothetical protein
VAQLCVAALDKGWAIAGEPRLDLSHACSPECINIYGLVSISTYKTEFWHASDKLFLPLLIIAILLLALNLCLRLVRPKLNVALFEVKEDWLIIHPVKHLQFSGWIACNPIEIGTHEIATAKIYDFYSHGTNTGMYWICIELKIGRLIECRINDYSAVKEVIDFIKIMLPWVELNIDDKIKF